MGRAAALPPLRHTRHVAPLRGSGPRLRRHPRLRRLSRLPLRHLLRVQGLRFRGAQGIAVVRAPAYCDGDNLARLQVPGACPPKRRSNGSSAWRRSAGFFQDASVSFGTTMNLSRHSNAGSMPTLYPRSSDERRRTGTQGHVRFARCPTLGRMSAAAMVAAASRCKLASGRQPAPDCFRRPGDRASFLGHLDRQRQRSSRVRARLGRVDRDEAAFTTGRASAAPPAAGPGEARRTSEWGASCNRTMLRQFPESRR